MNKNFFSLIGLICLSLMFCLPFLISYHKWPEANYYNQAVAFLLGILSLLVFFNRTGGRVAVPISMFVPLGLILILLLQWFFGLVVYWQESMLGVLYLLWSIALMLVSLQLRAIYGLERLVCWLAYALTFGGLFSVLVVLLQLVGADHFFWTFPRIRDNYTGNLAQVNLLTNYLSLSLVSMLYLHKINRLNLGFLYLFLVFVLFALSLTGSRMSWLYILLIATSFFYFGHKSELASWRRMSKIILLLPILYGVLQLVFPYIAEQLASNASAIPPAPAERIIEFAGNKSIRLDMLSQSLEIFAQYPILGVGWGQYPWYDLLMADTYIDHRGFIANSHNLFTQLMVECGLFACLIVFLGCLHWVVQLLKQKNTPERWWLMLVAGIIFTHSMLEYPLWYAYFLGVFVVVIALGENADKLRLPPIKPLIANATVGLMLVLGIGLVALTTYQYTKIEHWVNNYPRLSKAQRFQMLNDMSDMHQSTLIAEPLHMVLTRAYSILPRAQAPLKDKIKKYEVMMHYVQAKQDLYRYVLLLAADNRMDDAKAFLARAYTRQPGYAKHFEKQLEKGVKRGSKVHTTLYEELQRLKQRKR